MKHVTLIDWLVIVAYLLSVTVIGMYAASRVKSSASFFITEWLWLFAQPFYWMLTPLVRRMRIITIADYFQIRYGPSVSVLYALLGVLQLVVALAVMLKGSAVVIAAVSGGELDQHLAIVVMTVLVVAAGLASAYAMESVVSGLERNWRMSPSERSVLASN